MGKINQLIFSCLLFFVCYFIPHVHIFAQEKKVVVIKQSDKYIHTGDDGVDRIIGNVVITHDSTIMTCDSLYRYPDDRLQAFGNVHILQRDIDISGDEMDYDSNTGTANMRGHLVTMKKQTLVLRTTLFEYNTNSEIGKFHNGGTIVDSTLLLESTNGAFYSKENLFIFRNNVEMRTNDYEIISDSLSYNTETEITHFLGKTHIWHERGYLRCERGVYDKLGELFDFTKNSYVISGERELWADTIHYNSKESSGKFHNNVQIVDTLKEVIILGDYAEFTTSPEYMMATQLPSLVYFPNGQDSAYLRADTLKSVAFPNPNYKKDTLQINGSLPTLNIDSLNINNLSINDSIIDKDKLIDSTSSNAEKNTEVIDFDEFDEDKIEEREMVFNTRDSVFRDFFALHNTKVYRSDFQASCDTLFFSTQDSIGRMFNNPILWNQGNMQEVADFIIFYTKNQTIEKAEFRNNAFVTVEEDSLHYSQIKGRRMWAYFEEQELRQFDVIGNAQAIYYIRDKDSTLLLAEKIVGASEISAFLKEQKIKKISVRVNVESNSIPVDYNIEIPGKDMEIMLKGFAWHEDKRPKSEKEIIGDRELRPSERESIAFINKPSFPVTQRMDEREKNKP